MSKKIINEQDKDVKELMQEIDFLRAEVDSSHKMERLLREALDTFTENVILYDMDERVVFTNTPYHKTFPNSPPKNEIIGLTYEHLVRVTMDNDEIDHPLARLDPDAYVAKRLAQRSAAREKEGDARERTH